MAAMGKTLENQEPARRGAFISWRRFAIASFLIIALTVGILIANNRRGSDVDRGTRALIEAFSKQRLIEPRLSGGFKGGEFRSSRDSGSDIKTGELERARGLIMDAVAKGESGAELAYARLLLSGGEKLPEAQKYLRHEMVSSPDPAEPHNDLGVCLSLQGKLEEAIDEFEAALRQKADMPEALFNRALCYEQLLLRDAASTEYSRVLTIEREPDWLNEIKHRQQRTSSPLAPQKKETETVASFEAAVGSGDIVEAKRIVGEDFEIILKYARSTGTIEYLKESVAGHLEQAARSLAKLELIGRLFLETKEDSIVSDLTDHLHRLASGERVAELARVTEYYAAEKLVSSKRYSAAQAAFEQLSKSFAESGNNVFQIFSAYYTASCLYASGHLRSSIEGLRKGLSSVEQNRWPYLRAQYACQLGSAYSRLGEDSLAIRFCQQALKQGSGMRLLEAKSLQFIGNSYWHLGDLESGLARLRESTSFYLASVPTPYELAYNYLQLGDIYTLRGNHSLALLNARQAMTFLNQLNDNNRVAQASSFIAVEHARLGESDQAQKELSDAFDYLEKAEPGQRAYTEPLVLARAGEIAALRGDVERAFGNYERAEKMVEKSEEQITLMRVLRGRSEVYTQAKEFDKARLDLERAVDLIEGYRAGIADSADRSAFLDASQSVFDQLILLNIGALGRRAEAFDFSEQSRARTLLDESSSQQKDRKVQPANMPQEHDVIDLHRRKQGKPLRLAQVQAALPDDLRLLTYSVTRQRTYLFLITRSGFEVGESPATTETLDRLVQEYLSGLKNIDALEDLSAQASKLYEYLIEPVAGQLSDGKTLCIVPDKALHFLPFAALVDRSGEYLIKSYRLTYAPSASVLARCIEEARVKGQSIDEEILAVGNPRFDHDAFPTLANLEAADREASESAAFYPKSLILKGADATEDQVRTALKDCNVAHLAVHCLVEEKSPWLAALVLSKRGVGGQRLGSDSESSRDDGMLYLNEVSEISLPRTRLVVLSACQSGLGQYYRGEGIVSLIHPFLALRVPTVVASLWSVDSRATAELMIQFHRGRKANNIGASAALQAAQIRMIRSAEYQHPYYWAPFVSVGAN
jgi:CHAT domain-containing protein